MKLDAAKLRKMKMPTRDAVYLTFDVQVAPGETVEVRPDKAIRIRYKEAGRYCPAETVPLDSIKPFKPFQWGPIRGDAASFAAWSLEAGIVFLAVYLDSGTTNELVAGMEVPAHTVTYNSTWSTSKSASDVRFTVVNRGSAPVRFTGQIEGATPSEVHG